ncbi:MAG TPA: DUF72 domain-containing protein [Pelobium sp.]|nr:DUF72 domain-containing protein [Pelobium sp.]
MKKGSIRIGTSGWHYKHWKGTFYPSNVKEKDQLATFIQHFDTVEINNSFYRIPKEETFETWKKSVPGNFLFSVKANRYFTHLKKLNVSKNAIEDFLNKASLLEEKLGVILFQLPPGWKCDHNRLSSFLHQLPKGFRYTFEFRNATWDNEDTYSLLKQYNCAYCIYNLAGHLSPIKTTADFVYIRLHGPGGKYEGSYSDAELENWAKLVKQWSMDGKDVYVYFDNDQLGYAGFNAETLIQKIGKD